MKIIGLLIFLTITRTISYSQKEISIKPIIKLCYSFNFINPITAIPMTSEESAYVINKQTVYYISSTNIFTNSHPKSSVDKNGKPATDTIMIDEWNKRLEQDLKFLREKNDKNFSFMNLKENIYIVHRFDYGRNEFINIVDTVPNINWQLADSFKTIGINTCQKAIGTLRGRIYEAWFTAEIPVNGGPGNLYGLPGLILEAKSTDGQEWFTFKSLNIPSDIGFSVKDYPFNGKNISFEESEKDSQKQLKHIRLINSQELKNN